MAGKYLKPIYTVRSSQDLKEFSHVRSVSPDNFFSDFLHSLFDLLVMNTSYSVMLQVFVKTIYFYPGCMEKSFDKKHSSTVREFISALVREDLQEVKVVFYRENFKCLLDDIGQFVGYDPESYISPLASLLSHVKISVVEKDDRYEDYPWEVEDSLLTVSLYERDDKVFFLYPRKKLDLPVCLPQDGVLTVETDDVLESNTDDIKNDKAIEPYVSNDILESNSKTEDYLYDLGIRNILSKTVKPKLISLSENTTDIEDPIKVSVDLSNFYSEKNIDRINFLVDLWKTVILFCIKKYIY